MLLIKNRSILGGLKKAVKVIFEAVYKVLSFFNLQFTLLVGFVGLILYVTGLFHKYPQIRVWFLVAVVASVFLGLFLFIRKLFKKTKKLEDKADRGNVQTVRVESEQAETPKPKEEMEQTTPTVIQNEKPKYYNVAQNPNFIMAEYPDRYELYKKTPNGLVKVRTDLKNR